VSFLVDFQSRSRPVFQDAATRAQSGRIGEPVLAQVYYHAKPNQYHKTDGMTPEQARLRNWLLGRKLSGGIIVEQNVHVLDMANWFLNAPHPRLCDCFRRSKTSPNSLVGAAEYQQHREGDTCVGHTVVGYGRKSVLCFRK